MKETNTIPGAKIITPENYYRDVEYASFSGLKVFSKCEVLYRDTFVLKTYEEPEQEYFVYGRLVDAILTEGPKYVEDNFFLVERKLKVEDALRYENEIATLTDEIKGLEEKVAKGNKVAIKGKESRLKKISETQAKLAAIKEIATKQQVTPQMWEDAHATADAIKLHPYFHELEFDELTSQQIFTCELAGIKCKGKLDHLRLSNPVKEIYTLYKTGMIELPEMQKQILALDPDDRWGIITDIKTCYDLAKLEPFNYRGQLAMYQELVKEVLKIDTTCMILVGDKLHDLKKSELFSYPQEVLDDIKPDIYAWLKKWNDAVKHNTYISAKQKLGMDQDCFKCSECRVSPFSKVLGQPVVMTGPRFGKKEVAPAVADPDISEEVE